MAENADILGCLYVSCWEQQLYKQKARCIQGETGCGKSTRVPVYVMEDRKTAEDLLITKHCSK